MTEEETPTDHDLLIRIDERTQKLDRCFAEHMARHWALSLAAAGAAAAALFAAVVAWARSG